MICGEIPNMVFKERWQALEEAANRVDFIFIIWLLWKNSVMSICGVLE